MGNRKTNHATTHPSQDPTLAYIGVWQSTLNFPAGSPNWDAMAQPNPQQSMSQPHNSAQQTESNLKSSQNNGRAHGNADDRTRGNYVRTLKYCELQA